MDELEEIHKQIEELKCKAIEIAKKDRGPVIENMKKNIFRYGISANELGFSEKSAPVVKRVVPIKYKLGNETWSGRGPRPKLIRDYVKDGKDIKDLLVE